MPWNAEGMTNVFCAWADLIHANRSNQHWSTHWTLIGGQPIGFPTHLNPKATWVVPMDQSGGCNPTFHQSIIEACTGCMIIDPLNETEPMSFPLKNHCITAGEGCKFPVLHCNCGRIWQQTSSFPNADATEAITHAISGQQDSCSKWLTFVDCSGLHRLHHKSWHRWCTRALPWEEGIFVVAQDFFCSDQSLSQMFDGISLSAARELIDHFGEDHQMFWGACGKPDLEVDWPKKCCDSKDKV